MLVGRQKTLLYCLFGALALIVIFGGVAIALIVTSHQNTQSQQKAHDATQPFNADTSTQSSQGLSIIVLQAGTVGDDLQVGTTISGAQTGTCTLTVSQSGQKSITQTEAVTQQDEEYICPQFSVPLSKFPNQNEWNVDVTLQSAGQTTDSEWQNNPVDLSE